MLKEQTYALADLFNAHGIRWGLGGSSLLYYLGAEISPRDLDVVIHYDDIELGKRLLIEAGAICLEEKKSNNTYLTEQFYTFEWFEIEIDLMARPGIQKGDLIYRMPFDDHGAERFVQIENHQLWLCHPKDWFDYYTLMEGREHRLKQLAPYL